MNLLARNLTVFLTAAMLPAGAAMAQDQPERSDIVIGLPVTTSTFLPLYLAETEGIFEEEGLNVQIQAFSGGTDLVRGMVAGAVDMGVTSFAGVSLGIAADQPIRVFYGGFNMAIFDWYAIPEIESIEDVRGRTFGITTFGSSTDFLTRHALKANDLDPESDVNIVQGGGSAARMAAQEAGQIDVNIFAPPEKFMAEDMGYNRILTQAEDIAPDFPFHVFFAMEDYIAENPNTLRAVLRGFVRGVRLAKADRDHSILELMDRIGMDEGYAGRTYDDFIDMIYEDGRLPSDEGMQAFWEIGIEAGDYEEAWEDDRYLDRTFMDSFEDWKPEE